MSEFKTERFKLCVGDRVKGKKGGYEYTGTVLESSKKPNKPAVFSRYGFVGCWVQLDNGTKKVLNNLELA